MTRWTRRTRWSRWARSERSGVCRARRFGPLWEVQEAHAAAPFSWPWLQFPFPCRRGRRLVSSCDGPVLASPTAIFLSNPMPSTLRRRVSYTWRGRWRVQIFMRVGRPSHAAQRCPPVSFDGRAVAPLGRPTPRLVLRRADPGVARPLSPFPTPAGGPRTSRFIHVPRPPVTRRPSGATFPTWRGRLRRGAADGWSHHLRCGPSRWLPLFAALDICVPGVLWM